MRHLSNITITAYELYQWKTNNLQQVLIFMLNNPILVGV
jgi:hypothetical protein